MPPGDNGDYAWMQQVVKSLKPTGRAIVVMSQGILFRDQPAQTMEVDGRNEKAGPEYVIREGFVKADLIECVIVLPSKLFYGNTVPGCLVVLNKRKDPKRKDKILLICSCAGINSVDLTRSPEDRSRTRTPRGLTVLACSVAWPLPWPQPGWPALAGEDRRIHPRFPGATSGKQQTPCFRSRHFHQPKGLECQIDAP